MVYVHALKNERLSHLFMRIFLVCGQGGGGGGGGGGERECFRSPHIPMLVFS